ncbi:hypothetical protein CL622_03535 [archaeon]|nr:hypothetical protein [archaeon]|tara:strand:+ start:1333 stop:1896 length:564 start_codon:yes stop_codon:yes gene_type:complete
MIKFENENALEDCICQMIDDDGVNPINGAKVFYYERQVQLGSYCIADIICLEEVVYFGNRVGFYITVIELKNEILKPIDLGQLSRYLTALQNTEEGLLSQEFCTRGILLTKKLTNKNACDPDLYYLLNLDLNDIEMYEFTLDPNSGVEFNKSGGWHKTEDKKMKLEEFGNKSFEIALDAAEKEMEVQ